MVERMPRAAKPRMKVIIASLIALTSMLGAVAAWRASVASSVATDAERKGFADAVVREQRIATIGAQTDAILLDYIRGRSQDVQADEFEKEAEKAVGPDKARLEDDAKAYRGLADLTNDFVDKDSVRPDGSLDLERKTRLEMELARSESDLDSASDFEAADIAKERSEQLVGLTALLIAAAFFFTLAQISKSRVFLVYLGGGAIVLIVATALLFTVEIL